MYLPILIPAFLFTYWLLAVGFQYFFQKHVQIRYKLQHVLWIIGVFLCIIGVVDILNDADIANRFQHTFGGGFMMVLIVYFSFRASCVSMTSFQFSLLAFMIATTFGVANELVESILQNFANTLFASTINDTWFDLWANSIGALIGVGIFLFFLNNEKRL